MENEFVNCDFCEFCILGVEKPNILAIFERSKAANVNFNGGNKIH